MYKELKIYKIETKLQLTVWYMPVLGNCMIMLMNHHLRGGRKKFFQGEDSILVEDTVYAPSTLFMCPVARQLINHKQKQKLDFQ